MSEVKGINERPVIIVDPELSTLPEDRILLMQLSDDGQFVVFYVNEHDEHKFQFQIPVAHVNTLVRFFKGDI